MSVKGYWPRQRSVPRQERSDRWDRTFPTPKEGCRLCRDYRDHVSLYESKQCTVCGRRHDWPYGDKK